MPAKKSMPDARVSGIPSLEQGLMQGSKGKTGTPNKLEKLDTALNKTGKASSSHNISISGNHDVKTDVAIPSVKSMTSKVSRQMRDNVKINKKYRGED